MTALNTMHAIDALAKLNDTDDSINFIEPDLKHESHLEQLNEVLDQVREIISPVWPLKDYVAINPYAGMSERRFLGARGFLRAFSDCETLMPLSYYADQLQLGRYGRKDIEDAIEELKDDFAGLTLDLSASQVVEQLRAVPTPETKSAEPVESPNDDRRVNSISEQLDRHTDSEWTANIRDEISKHCSAHYDDGQAVWSSPWKGLPLYQAWRSAAIHDRNIELLGLSGFRKFVSQLPHTPEAAIAILLQRLGVPERLWEAFLLCQAFTIPGWSAWVKYQVDSSDKASEENSDLAGLLAMRLAYDVALSERFNFRVNWAALTRHGQVNFEAVSDESSNDAMLRYTLLRANELGYQRNLLTRLAGSTKSPEPQSPATQTRKLAQMVFCIDVRSERMRRNLESTGGEIETFGFAGFFGLPIEFVAIGETSGTTQVPVLLKPQFKMYEGLHEEECQASAKIVQRRSAIRMLRKAWKQFQSSAVSCFSCVETSGILYGLTLLARTLRVGGKSTDSKFDGVSHQDQPRLGPTLRGLNQQGLTTSHQADMAESILRGMGLTDEFARLVVFCGHGSQVKNNPLKAGLDCGACGGHSGEANARFAAMLMNQPYIRQALAERGIVIPEDVHFLAALHNTTTDAIELFDVADVPQSHLGDVEELVACAKQASERTQIERLPLLASESVSGLMNRSADWSEVRPEWGLAGNAAFIAAPRSLTDSSNLAGRAFLHNYDHHKDPESKVLETIMTAPLVVAHWINMQYYASTVDNRHFGSGTKTVHNVVGRFGVLSGNSGDLMTGLPWESLHDGENYQHLPLRLLAVIAAPRSAIEQVIAKHSVLENLLTNGWLHLVAVEDQDFYRYTEHQAWESLESDVLSVC